MVEKQVVTVPETVACEICLLVVPRSVAESLEGTDYVYYFCGADCFAQWRTTEGETVVERRRSPR